MPRLRMQFGPAAPRPWSFEYSETDGYDCMTGAFTIYDANHEVVAVVDQSDFGQENCAYRLIPSAEAVARRIVEAVNSSNEEEI